MSEKDCGCVAKLLALHSICQRVRLLNVQLSADFPHSRYSEIVNRTQVRHVMDMTCVKGTKGYPSVIDISKGSL